jgi:hypothetical protein
MVGRRGRIGGRLSSAAHTRKGRAAPSNGCLKRRPALANFQGVTGFGSAIISLCTWIVFKSVGVQSGEDGLYQHRAQAQGPDAHHKAQRQSHDHRILGSLQRPHWIAAPWLQLGFLASPGPPLVRRFAPAGATRCIQCTAGTLVQAVVTEALASTPIAPWLLYVTRAHQTADLRIVSAIALFVVGRPPVAGGGARAAPAVLRALCCAQHSGMAHGERHAGRGGGGNAHWRQARR